MPHPYNFAAHPPNTSVRVCNERLCVVRL